MIRAWAKKNEVACFVKPKGASRTDSFAYKFRVAIVANPGMTEAECKDFVVEHGTAGTLNALAYFQGQRELVNQVKASIDLEYGAVEAA